MNDRPAVVLLSGGLDSYTAAAMMKAEGFRLHALTVRYGQVHAREIAAARAVARHLGIADHLELSVDLAAVGGSALTGSEPVPKDRPLDRPEIPSTYVPARNTVFLALAMARAEVIGARDLVLGVNAVDYSGYPDCRPAFLEAFERLASVATKAGVEGARLVVHAPLLRLSKAEIIRRGVALGLDYALTHSCYDPLADQPCGRCDSCRLRARGFAEAGVPDPLLAAPRRHRDPDAQTAAARAPLDVLGTASGAQRIEQQPLDVQLIQRERLAAVGRLIAGIAHELNNPLQVIIGLIDLMEHQAGGTAISGDLALIRDQSLRAGEIVRNLLQFVRTQPQSMVPIDLGDVAASIVRLRRGELETRGIVLTTEIASPGAVQGVFAELQQVVLNLVVNAEHAVEARGGEKRIAIRVARVNGSARLEVADSGAGVRPDDESKLFQPFFTTKPPGQGTGLGLSLSYGIIQAHGGRIGYEPNRWGGATFFFELPTTNSG